MTKGSVAGYIFGNRSKVKDVLASEQDRSIDFDRETMNSWRVRVRPRAETANAHMVALDAIARLARWGIGCHHSFRLQPSISVENDRCIPAPTCRIRFVEMP
jgi:hypothetical protein